MHRSDRRHLSWLGSIATQLQHQDDPVAAVVPRCRAPLRRSPVVALLLRAEPDYCRLEVRHPQIECRLRRRCGACCPRMFDLVRRRPPTLWLNKHPAIRLGASARQDSRESAPGPPCRPESRPFAPLMPLRHRRCERRAVRVWGGQEERARHRLHPPSPCLLPPEWRSQIRS